MQFIGKQKSNMYLMARLVMLGCLDVIFVCTLGQRFDTLSGWQIYVPAFLYLLNITVIPSSAELMVSRA